MKIRALARCSVMNVELVFGEVYDLPDDTAQHLINLELAEKVSLIIQEIKRPAFDIKTNKRPVRRGTKVNNG